MGFRSVFITEDMKGVAIPAWFAAKYSKYHWIWMSNEGQAFFPIAQFSESKYYGALAETEIFQDLQRILIERTEDHPKKITLVLLHECDGITRVQITRDSITGREPTDWKDVDHVEHDYCYGCSD